MFDLFLNIIAVLSGIITVITGTVTIIGYFSPKPVSPSQTKKQPAQPPQKYIQLPLPNIQITQQSTKQRNRLSHPKIALIALLGQVLLFVAVSLYAGAAFEYFVTYGSNHSGTSEENLLGIISIVLALVGLVCTITALVMSLIKSKQLHRWGWFASLMLGFIIFSIMVLPAFIPLLFGIFGPTEQARHQPSYPRITVIALLGQVFSFAALGIVIYNSLKYGTNSPEILRIIFILIALVGVICAVIALVMSLIKSKQLHRWGWFTGLVIGFIFLFVYFLPALMPLLFGIFGPTEQKAVKTQTALP